MLIKLRKKTQCAECSRDIPRGEEALLDDFDQEVFCASCEEEALEGERRVRRAVLRAFPLIARCLERGVLDANSFTVGTGYTITEALLDILDADAPEGCRPAATKADIELAEEVWEDLRTD